MILLNKFSASDVFGVAARLMTRPYRPSLTESASLDWMRARNWTRVAHVYGAPTAALGDPRVWWPLPPPPLQVWVNKTDSTKSTMSYINFDVFYSVKTKDKRIWQYWSTYNKRTGQAALMMNRQAVLEWWCMNLKGESFTILKHTSTSPFSILTRTLVSVRRPEERKCGT